MTNNNLSFSITIFIILTLFILAGCLFPRNINAADLKDFKSDKCSMFPEGTLQDKNLWCHCCVEHDKAYWKGGSFEERKEADNALKICVKKMGKKHVARAMKIGVRLFGTPYLPTSFRWGYGWPYQRGYTEISIEENEMVKLKMVEYNLSEQLPLCKEKILE